MFNGGDEVPWLSATSSESPPGAAEAASRILMPTTEPTRHRKQQVTRRPALFSRDILAPSSSGLRIDRPIPG
jgi:hypothetical protein